MINQRRNTHPNPTSSKSFKLKVLASAILLGAGTQLLPVGPALAESDEASLEADAPRTSADPFDTALEPGDFIWQPELAETGQIHAYVDLGAQLVTVYRGNTRIGVSTISSGMEGYETPTGVFEILQKKVEHYSNLYNDAPMPYMQRLTWDGIAFHVGKLPGEAASHGCIRLPEEFAVKFFEATEMGAPVEIVGTTGSPDVTLAANETREMPLTPRQQTAALNKAAASGTFEVAMTE